MNDAPDDGCLELVDEIRFPKRIWILQTVMLVLVGIAMLKFVPSYERIFKDFDAELPALTMYVLDAADWCASYWYLAVTAWGGLLAALYLICRNGDVPTALVINNVVVVAGVLWLLFVALSMYLPVRALVEKLN